MSSRTVIQIFKTQPALLYIGKAKLKAHTGSGLATCEAGTTATENTAGMGVTPSADKVIGTVMTVDEQKCYNTVSIRTQDSGAASVQGVVYSVNASDEPVNKLAQTNPTDITGLTNQWVDIPLQSQIKTSSTKIWLGFVISASAQFESDAEVMDTFNLTFGNAFPNPAPSVTAQGQFKAHRISHG